MDTVTEDSVRSDVDPEMTMLTPDDITDENTEASDEVENLRNSLREAVHDESIQPKMQCLMMDSSFSMVTMQGEDSGIAWETTPSPCTTPRATEATAMDVSSPAPVQAGIPGSRPAGKIIFVMDEEMISRQRKNKEKMSSQKYKLEKQDVLEEGYEGVSGRPELVEVSQPNLKDEEEGNQEEAMDPLANKEQCLFSIVSEGFEILNIVVPPKLATVDEEESKEMVDNLSYLEESPVPKTNEETQDNELPVSMESTIKSLPTTGPSLMDPPGAPVARAPGRRAAGTVDYFDAFSLVDAQAPGSPAVVTHQQEEPKAEAATVSQETKKPGQSEDRTISKRIDKDKSDTVSLEEITSELLDDVFYGSTDSYPIKSLDAADELRGTTFRLPSKPSGSTLFSSQEDILTPVFLPEGPPKIIDPILLEEPKAMAFLYTDLYEEAVGSRKKEEDTESMTSEKSFHSRHSDREARGYLEKYALIDETPAIELEHPDQENFPEEEQRILPQELLDFEDLLPKAEKEMQHPDEITDFFRSSANSSPCDIEPFPQSLEEDNTQTTIKRETKTQKSVSIAVGKPTETPVDLFDSTSFDFPSELDWEVTDDDFTALDERHLNVRKDDEALKQDSETNKPVAPPRKKTTSSTKACLDLTPLTPVHVITQENEEAGGKEQRVEEKETASPPETADEGDGDAEEITQAASKAALSESTQAEMKEASSENENVKDSDEVSVKGTKPAQVIEAKTDEDEGRSQTTTATEQMGLNEMDVVSDVTAERIPETQEDKSTEPAKIKGQCIIL